MYAVLTQDGLDQVVDSLDEAEQEIRDLRAWGIFAISREVQDDDEADLLHIAILENRLIVDGEGLRYGDRSNA